MKQSLACSPLEMALPIWCSVLLGATAWGAGAEPGVVDLNTPRDFPTITTAAEWQARAQEIREQILVSCGLWPLPVRTALKVRVFDRIDRDDYSIEKVYFQTYPGFYLAGNLYRPLGQGAGPFPAILNPHGHWTEGRLADNQDGSISARCISFARQGMIAFSYDMVGYNDTRFANSPPEPPASKASNTHEQFATNAVDQLWSVSLMGLQTWNSIRALDFLASLPDADPHRLACTGESGGGTQTFMLGAVDARLAVQAPIVMVSHTMQGGCLCENAPGLRVRYSNMEIAAVAAPRPQILVAAAGDWTKDTLTMEGPAIAHIYDLFKAAANFHYVRFDFGHNYNQTSRETVYGWFGKWLLNHPSTEPVKEQPYHKEPDATLRVWAGDKLPADALTQDAFVASLVQMHQAQWNALLPHSPATLDKFKRVLLPGWRHTLQIDWPEVSTQLVWKPLPNTGAFVSANLESHRPGEPARPTSLFFAPPGNNSRRPPDKVVILADEAGSARYCDPAGGPQGLARSLVERGCSVLVLKKGVPAASRDQFSNFYTTYNRTELQQCVRDLLTTCAQAGRLAAGVTRVRVLVCGIGRAGLWALLAAPGADAVIADAAQLDSVKDEALLAPDLFCPGLRNIGTFEGGAMLAVPHPLLVHNTGGVFSTTGILAAYQAAGAANQFRAESRKLSEQEILKWVLRTR